MDITEKSWLECMHCSNVVPLYETRKFRCHCGGLYDVCHSFPKQNKVNVLLMTEFFDSRQIYNYGDSILFSSGVWRFHELIMPSLHEKEIISLGEGIIPFWPAGNNIRKWIGTDLDLWILPEGLTPTGSFKDFGGTVAISVAKKMGVKTVACASTGDTSAMAAAYAAKAGIKCVVVLPKGRITDVQLAQPLAHGAEVILIPGNFDKCMNVVLELAEAGRIFPINSINPTRIEGHQASVFLATQFFGWQMPDVFVVPVGNGSNSSSIGKGMRLLRDLGFVKNIGKLIGVQSEAANPLARSWELTQDEGVAHQGRWKETYRALDEIGETTATAALIGNPVSWEKVMREINESRGAVLTASEKELNEAVMVAGKDGHFVCPQTGMALAGLRQAVERGFVKKGQRVVVISTATGLKFPNVPAQYGKHLIKETKTCETEEIAQIIGV